MDELPLIVDDAEKVVRAIMCPSHIKEGTNKLKPAAFRSKGGTDEVSVMRHQYLGSDKCKAKGKELGSRSISPSYVGLAVVKAHAIRSSGSTIQDSREVYLGHAHISHGMILPANEPPDPEISLAITERCKAILAETKYHPDLDPNSDTWSGPDL